MPLEAMFKPRLCELGKIKIGKKEERIRETANKVKWRAPQKIDHFLITTMHRKTDLDDFVLDEELMAELKEEHADRDGLIRTLPIYVLSNEVDDVMQSAWLWYKGRSLLAAKSDGNVLTKYCDPKTGTKLETPEEVPWQESFKDLKFGGGPMFKKHTTFNCVIASKRGRWGGVYKFRTTSAISGEQLYSSLLHVKQLTAGVLRGLPLSLVVRPIVVRPEGKATTVYVVHVELRGADLHELQTRALEQKRFEVEHMLEMRRSEEQYRKMLKPPGDEEDAVEIADIADEFTPDVAASELGVVEHDPLMDEIEGLSMGAGFPVEPPIIVVDTLPPDHEIKINPPDDGAVPEDK